MSTFREFLRNFPCTDFGLRPTISQIHYQIKLAPADCTSLAKCISLEPCLIKQRFSFKTSQTYIICHVCNFCSFLSGRYCWTHCDHPKPLLSTLQFLICYRLKDDGSKFFKKKSWWFVLLAYRRSCNDCCTLVFNTTTAFVKIKKK